MAAQNDVEMAEDVGEDSAPLFEAVGEVDDHLEGIGERLPVALCTYDAASTYGISSCFAQLRSRKRAWQQCLKRQRQ